MLLLSVHLYSLSGRVYLQVQFRDANHFLRPMGRVLAILYWILLSVRGLGAGWRPAQPNVRACLDHQGRSLSGDESTTIQYLPWIIFIEQYSSY